MAIKLISNPQEKLSSFEAVRIDSLENIGSNKITAICGRTEGEKFFWEIGNRLLKRSKASKWG